MNTPRLTTRTVDECEDVIAVIDRIFADGVVEPHELDELRAELEAKGGKVNRNWGAKRLQTEIDALG